VNAGIQYYQLRRKNFPIGDAKLPLRIRKIILCAVLMAAVALFLTLFIWSAPPASLMWKIADLCLLIGLSGASYAVALHVTKTITLDDVREIIGRK